MITQTVYDKCRTLMLRAHDASDTGRDLHCTGCWAGEYGNRLNLSCDEIDDIIEQGKELGIYMYIYTGGEPLVLPLHAGRYTG